MSYSIEKLPGDPVIIGMFSDGFSVANHLEPFLDELKGLLDDQAEPVYYVVILDGLSLSLEDLLVSTNVSSRGDNPALHHPNLRGTIAVTDSKMIKLAAKGMNSDLFGNLRVDVFETAEEALAFVRSQNGA